MNRHQDVQFRLIVYNLLKNSASSVFYKRYKNKHSKLWFPIQRYTIWEQSMLHIKEDVSNGLSITPNEHMPPPPSVSDTAQPSCYFAFIEILPAK